MNAWNLLQHWSNRPTPSLKLSSRNSKFKHTELWKQSCNNSGNTFSSSKNLSIYRFLPETEKFTDNSNYTITTIMHHWKQTITRRRILLHSLILHYSSILCFKEHVLRNHTIDPFESFMSLRSNNTFWSRAK